MVAGHDCMRIWSDYNALVDVVAGQVFVLCSKEHQNMFDSIVLPFLNDTQHLTLKRTFPEPSAWPHLVAEQEYQSLQPTHYELAGMSWRPCNLLYCF